MGLDRISQSEHDSLHRFTSKDIDFGPENHAFFLFLVVKLFFSSEVIVVVTAEPCSVMLNENSPLNGKEGRLADIEHGLRLLRSVEIPCGIDTVRVDGNISGQSLSHQTVVE